MTDQNLLLQEGGYPNAPDIKAIETWPKRIYLQHGDYGDDPEPFDYREAIDISWCAEKIQACDVEYVRADIVEQLERELAEARKDAELLALLPSSYYMDPPDGGSVSVLEQLQRMAKDAERYRWLRESQPSFTGLWVAMGLPQIAVSCWRGAELDSAIDAAMKDKP